ncbi:MAG: FMN-binding glutamate synthase family protein, partial [Firmicutes bacterium]|nr:FMN-binding glutamate synthase family protein [Bacillota bacterium]
KFACLSEVDLVTFDSAGGGTGKSPWKMMNEWGLPTVYLESLLHEFFGILKGQGLTLPRVAVAGGFALEDQIFKGLALGAPHVNLIGMCRAPMAAAMVGKRVGELVAKGQVPKHLQEYGTSREEIFAKARELKEIYGPDYTKIGPGAIGVYNYVERLKAGLRLLMALNRKFSLEDIGREDIFALTREAAAVSGIALPGEMDREEIRQILGS